MSTSVMSVVVPNSVYLGGNSLGPHRSLVVAERDFGKAYRRDYRWKVAEFPFIDPKKASFHVVLSYCTGLLAEMASHGVRTMDTDYDREFREKTLPEQEAIIDKRRQKVTDLFTYMNIYMRNVYQDEDKLCYSLF